MTDAFLPIDAVLWSAAVTLAGVATWLSRPQALAWEPDAFFAAIWSVLRRPAPLALREGPIPASGWDGDVTTLEEDLDPVARLGPTCTWEAVGAFGPEVQAVIARRLGHVVALWLEEPAFELPGVRTVGVADAARVDEVLEELCAPPEARFVLFAARNAGGVLRRLHAEPGFRDRVRAVVFVGAELGGDRDWIADHFTHTAFDLEMSRELPFFTLRVEGGGAQVLREPPASNRTCIRVVDLGLTPTASLADPALPRAFALVLAALE